MFFPFESDMGNYGSGPQATSMVGSNILMKNNICNTAGNTQCRNATYFNNAARSSSNYLTAVMPSNISVPITISGSLYTINLNVMNMFAVRGINTGTSQMALNLEWLLMTYTATAKASLPGSLATVATSGYVYGTAGFDINKWGHFALTIDEKWKMTLYVNAYNLATSTGTNNFNPNTYSELLIGGGNGNGYHGYIKDFRVYPFALNSTAISAIYNAGSPAMSNLCVPSQCASGSFWSASMLACSQCPAGSYCSPGSTASAQCPAGTFSSVNATACSSCPIDTYSTVGASTCTACPVNSTCANGILISSMQCAANVCSIRSSSWTPPQLCPSFSNTYVAGASSVLNCSCVPGYYSSNGSAYGCSACPPGTFANGTGSFSCTACNAGFFSGSAGATVCGACQAGTFSGVVGKSACDSCSSGSYAAANASSTCTACAAGSFAGQTGQSSCATCNISNYCPSGSSTPVTCAVGSYCPNASVQLSCDLGNYCPLGSTTQNACKAGSFCSNPTSQVTCDANYYCPSSTTTQKACRTCTTNARLVNSCPSNSSEDVMSCTCNAGYYGDGFGCSACEANYWCVGGSAHSQCPSNTNGPSQSSDQNGCVCNAGFYWVGSVNGTSPCALCQAGSYCAGGNTVPSIACPAHAESPPGSVTIAQCVCTAGYYPLNNNINQCTLCPPGAFCSSGNLSTCPANSSSLGQGSSSKSACTCNAGYYGDPSNAGCMRCPMNAYCEGGFSYKNCTANAVTGDLGSINASACYCDRGLLGVNNTACSVCEAGQWCWTGMANKCPNNTMSQPRSTHISNCTCNVGYSGDKGGPVCDLCVAGKYASANGSSFCTSCVAGTYSTALRSISASTCQNCSIGTFNAQPAGNSSGACIACAAGSYSQIEGASACSRCKRGFYMPLQGSTGCIPCPWRTQTLDNSSQNSEGTCLCLPSWNCTYTRRARTQLQLSVNVNLDNLTRTLDAWAQINAVEYNVNLV